MKSSARTSLAIIASLVVLAQLADNLHVALVRHDFCAEHGELVEAGVSGPLRPVDALDGVETHFDRGTAVDAAQHEHCLASIATRQGATLSQPLEVLAALPPVAQQPSGSAVAHATLDSLRLAPKQSPPAV